jgi:poly(hydroxyalkanoate) depolymerase family esterase
MKTILPEAICAATRLTRTGRLMEATAVLQRMLHGGGVMGDPTPEVRRGPPTINGVAERVETARETAGLQARSRSRFLDAVDRGDFQLPGAGLARPSFVPAPVVVPQGAQFLTATFSNHVGSRPYKLYVPSGYRADRPASVIVMLHGCTQSPDDFAAGTRMNESAEAHGCLVVYPAQTRAANKQKCWNWFNSDDQQRDGGEPSLIAGITRTVMRSYAVDPRRVYVAGLSAGGAAAAIMGATYPDLYAAIGVHSGIACGAASDLPAAYAVMQRGGAGAMPVHTPPRIVPTIVFHGDNDSTVNPLNGDAVVAQATKAAGNRRHTEDGQVIGGHSYRRTRHFDADGRTVVEQWVVHGAGHAWFGGSPAGSYTDPRGPDATKEMVRFFLEHANPTVGSVA